MAAPFLKKEVITDLKAYWKDYSDEDKKVFFREYVDEKTKEVFVSDELFEEIFGSYDFGENEESQDFWIDRARGWAEQFFAKQFF